MDRGARGGGHGHRQRRALRLAERRARAEEEGRFALLPLLLGERIGDHPVIGWGHAYHQSGLSRRAQDGGEAAGALNEEQGGDVAQEYLQRDGTLLG